MYKFVKATLPVVSAVVLFILGTAVVSRAGGPPRVPEIDVTAGASALALISGAVLIIRARRKK